MLSHTVTEATVVPQEQRARLVAHFVLYLFNVQVFAFVSGSVSTRIDLRRKAKGLLLPLGSWLIVFAGLSGPLFFSALVGSPNGALGVLDGLTPLWFLWALFLTFCVIKGLESHRGILVAVALASGVLWPVLPAWTAVRGLGIVLPYVVLGREVALRSGSAITRDTRWFPLALLVFAPAATILFKVVGTPLWIGTDPPRLLLFTQMLALVAGCSACIGLLGVAQRLRGRLLRSLAYLGTASMGIYGVHWLLIVAFPEAFRARSLALIPVQGLLLLAVSLLLNWLVSLVPLARTALLGGRGPQWESSGADRTKASSGRRQR